MSSSNESEIVQMIFDDFTNRSVSKQNWQKYDICSLTIIHSIQLTKATDGTIPAGAGPLGFMQDSMYSLLPLIEILIAIFGNIVH